MARAPSTSNVLEAEDLKVAMRERAREDRLHQSDRLRAEAAQALAAHTLALPAVQSASCVSVYASRPSEPGTLPLIAALADRGVRVLIPRLGDGLQRGWAEYLGATDLTPRAPGRPPEPSGPFLPQAAVADADVVVTPALAVDPSGTRLGEGGGWYDRCLPDARSDALILAYCFPEEVRDSEHPVPHEAHDAPVHGVVTPAGVTLFDRTAAT
jgi:5-formyltetrahydrofolate cyclo-ligase